MATYESVTNRNGYTNPAYRFTCPIDNHVYDWPGVTDDPPSSETKEYTPLVQSQFGPIRDDTFKRSFPPRDKSILMSPWYAGNSSTRRTIVSRQKVTKHWYLHAYAAGATCCHYNPRIYFKSWTENFSYEELSKTLDEIDGSSGGLSDQIATAVAATQADAYSKAESAVDILTEIAEARETLQLLSGSVKGAASILQGVRDTDPKTWRRGWGLNFRQLMQKARPFRVLARAWLTARYGVLPLVYTIRSVNEELERADYHFATERSERTITVPPASIPASPERFLHRVTDGKIVVRSTVKSGYPGGRLQRLLDRSAFNPFSTVWELIPYSFVVDWFFNVGDTIRSHTSIDLSTDRKACTSVKTNLAERVYYVDRSKDVSSIDAPENPCRPRYVDEYVYQRNIYDECFTIETDTYDRFLFERPPIAPVFDPHVTWERVIDAISLSLDPAMRKFAKLGQ